MNPQHIIYIVALAAALTGCTTSVPSEAADAGTRAEIYPDYHDVTIPGNIAPLNFRINVAADKYITHIHGRDGEGLIVDGKTLDVDIDKWHDLLCSSRGDTIYADIYAKTDGKWLRYQPIKWTVAEDIDPYVTYRLIEPSFVNFEVMRICQRNLENYDEDEIFNNCTFSDNVDGQCINCHVPQDYNRQGRWQMHVRLKNGGTLVDDGKTVKKVNLKRPGTISAGVYPAWHPIEPLVVYSNNTTVQAFHHSDPNKIEVQDKASDLILYDIERDEVTIIANDTTQWETFPAWSPDASHLYYVSATVPAMNQSDLSQWCINNYKDVKYDIYRRAYDALSKTFGSVDTVYMASEHSASATLPRVSPDGRYLLFTQAEYGTFHIWHHDADLYLMDLQSGDMRPLDEVNSADTESYHNWSSNGRWIVFSSRRDDGSYTRLYLAYFDKDGNAHKPFLLPQRDPQSNINLYKSYNVPELMIYPNDTGRQEIIDAISQN